jgi:hypothetical protein
VKTVIVKFPVEKKKSQRDIKSQVYDFLVGAIDLRDLSLQRQDLLQLTFNISGSQEEYDFEGETFDLHDVEITGEDKTIDTIEQWQKGFEQSLN